MAGQAAQIKRTLEQLFASQPDDLRLRDHLEGLIRDPAFSGLTWFWGPTLYERNRAIYRPLILDRFSDWGVQTPAAGATWKRVEWKTHAKRLEAWLADARANRDAQLVRRLLRWKYATPKTGTLDTKRWPAALVDAFKTAPAPAARAVVLDEFDDWFLLDETTAIALYTVDPASRSFILRHIPRRYFWDDARRAMWGRLARAAQVSGDEELYFALYRATMPIGAWAQDARELARNIADPAVLVTELERRHPEGTRTDHRQESVMLELLRQRGRDVIPYVRQHMGHLRSGLFGNVKAFIDLAAANGWWDLWAAVLHMCTDARPFNSAVDGLLAQPLKEEDRLSRLNMLAGVSREWNWPGASLARIQPLQDDVAVRLYQRYPHLVRGAFLAHVTPAWGNACPRLLQTALDAKDTDLVDILASRYVTRTEYRYFRGADAKAANEQINSASSLAAYYQHIRDTDPGTFARRASNVLTRIPANVIGDYAHLLRTNALARLLFMRSSSAFLADDCAVQDLVEGSNIYVQMLAYRVLAADDDRARALGAGNLDILLGTLLRPLHRKTRLPAFDALANAARTGEDNARRILARAHDAMKLADKRYPKAELAGLIARILYAVPVLRRPDECPAIYGFGAEAAQ